MSWRRCSRLETNFNIRSSVSCLESCVILSVSKQAIAAQKKLAHMPIIVKQAPAPPVSGLQLACHCFYCPVGGKCGMLRPDIAIAARPRLAHMPVIVKQAPASPVSGLQLACHCFYCPACGKYHLQPGKRKNWERFRLSWMSTLDRHHGMTSLLWVSVVSLLLLSR